MDDRLAQELAAIDGLLESFDRRFPEIEMPPKPPAKLWHKKPEEYKRLDRERLDASHNQCHRRSALEALQKAQAKFQGKIFDRRENQDWLSKTKLESLYRLYLDRTHYYHLLQPYISGCPVITPYKHGSQQTLENRPSSCLALAKVEIALQYLDWYGDILEYEFRAEFRAECVRGLLEQIKTWPRPLLARHIELCQKALSDLQAIPPVFLTAVTGKVLRDLPPPQEAKFLNEVLATLETYHTQAADNTATISLPPHLVKGRERLPTYRLLASIEDAVTLDTSRQLLFALARLQPRENELAFSLMGLGDRGEIVPTISIADRLYSEFENLLLTCYPNAQLEPIAEDAAPEEFTAAAEYRMNSPMGILHVDLSPDPFALFCSALQNLQPGELGLVCVEFVPNSIPLGTSRRTWPDGVSETQVCRKNDELLWAVGLKILTIAGSHSRAVAILQNLEQHLGQFNESHTRLVCWNVTEEENFLIKAGARNIDQRLSLAYELPPALWKQNLLSTDELAAFIHLPHKSISCSQLLRANTVQKKAPDELTTPEGLLLGTNEWRRQTKDVRLPHQLRTRHMYIVGGSGSGKSALLCNLVKQDIEEGRGCCVIDPHGDLVTKLLAFIPQARAADLILINPSDRDYPVSLNPFAVETDDDDRNSVALTFQTVFMRMFGVGSEAPRMLHLLHMSTAALLEAGNKTFLDIRKFFINPDFRNEVLEAVQDPTVLEFWYEEFSRYSKDAATPINTRLTQFSMSPITRNILGQKQQTFNLYDAMNAGQIVLCSLGIIEEQERQLLGSLLVSQLQLAAMRRAAMPEADRRPFIAYIDEFQNFAAADEKAMEKILSEARKYGLGLVLAHQYTTQIPPKLADAIMANTHSKIIFSVSADDARYLQKSLPDFTPEDLQKQDIGHAVMLAGKSSFSLHTNDYPKPPANNLAAAAIERSRQTYGRPRAEVERELRPQKPAVTEPTLPETSPSASVIEFPSPKKPATPTSPKPQQPARKKTSLFDELLGND